jgi:hypothetical protein
MVASQRHACGGLRAAGASEETIHGVRLAAQMVTWLLLLRRIQTAGAKSATPSSARPPAISGSREKRVTRARVGSSHATPKRLPKKRDLSTRKARLEVGEAFNKAQASKYPYNEIRIVDPNGGRPYVLDSYNPDKGEIVFRRDTQFSEIKPNTAKAYLREFTKKYAPGRTIANVPSSGDLAGKVLRGDMIFEVPPQWKKIPSEVLKQADKLRIAIRDSNGKVYE